MLLADYQHAFARALLADDPRSTSPDLARLVAQPGFAVYRNTVLRGCIDALQANFPAVARLVGDEWFRAAAAVYARREPPDAPTLLTYGQTFAAFLAQFEPAAELPYLADVARIDRLWSEAHVAADDDTLDPATLAQLAPEDLRRHSLRPHATARWAWCEEHPIYTLWSRNRESVGAFDAEIDWCGEGVLLTRPHGAVEHQTLTREGAAFLSACADGLSIERAVAAVLETNPAADLAALINQFLQAGAFARLQAVTFEDA
jgi:Putative DNA-binding domain